MQEDLIQENIERVKNASVPDLIGGAFQIFITRLPVIALAVTIINLPVVLYYALYRTEFNFPFSVDNAGEVVIHEALLQPYYIELLIDAGIWLYLLLVVLAVAFVVELTIHGEYPDLNGVINHAIGHWWDGMRTGLTRISLYLGIFLGATLIGTLIAALLGSVIGSTAGVVVGIGISLLVALVPFVVISVIFFFDINAASLRDVGGRDALLYSLRVSRGNWMSIVAAIFAMLVLVNLPVWFLQFGLASIGIGEMPVAQVIAILLFNILQSFALVVYSLIFLHLDYKAGEVEA
jgi:hypothetical protein